MAPAGVECKDQQKLEERLGCPFAQGNYSYEKCMQWLQSDAVDYFVPFLSGQKSIFN